MKPTTSGKDIPHHSTCFREMVGILGGVGPEATNYFISLLIKQRSEWARRDQDHIPFVVFNNPQIPDRSDFLINGGVNPLPELIRTASVLKKAGSTFVVIPCNTVHPFVKEIEREVGIRVMNMIELTVDYVVNHFGANANFGILATDGTIKAGIYQDAFSRFSSGTKLIFPKTKTQKLVMKAIYDIKSASVNDENTQILMNAAEELIQEGANLVILGCTEIPLAIRKNKRLFPMVDPMEVLAKEVIKRVVESKVEFNNDASYGPKYVKNSPFQIY